MAPGATDEIKSFPNVALSDQVLALIRDLGIKESSP